MSEIIRSIVLGIIQGLTEFLPVSSSGHIELAKYFLGYTGTAEESIFLTVVLHLATALSTVLVFRKDVAEIFKGLFSAFSKNGFQKNEQWDFSIKIILSMIPAAMVGIIFEEQMETLFDKQIILVGCMLLLTGVLLFLADRAKNTKKKVSFVHSIIIGISQALAIMPGISRSGATISTSVLLGIDRTRAAKFSFLMVVPLILGKVAKDILDADLKFDSSSTLELGLGFLAAFLTGLFACTWMIKIVKNSQLKYFSYYCFAVGIFAIGFKLLEN